MLNLFKKINFTVFTSQKAYGYEKTVSLSYFHSVITIVLLLTK